MVVGVLRWVLSLEGLLTLAVLGAVVLGGAHVAGVVDLGDVVPRNEWTGADDLEEDAPWLIATSEGPWTDDLVNGELNDARHDAEVDTLAHQQHMRDAADEYVDLARREGAAMTTFQDFRCQSSGAIVTSRLEYESRHDPETGVEVNADHHRVARDAVERALAAPERRETLLDPGWTQHGVEVVVGDHGTVYVVQAVC